MVSATAVITTVVSIVVSARLSIITTTSCELMSLFAYCKLVISGNIMHTCQIKSCNKGGGGGGEEVTS